MDKPRDDDLELQLCRYLDGQLPRRERLALEKRLDEDQALREELRRYAALDACLQEIAGGEVDGVDYDLQRAGIIAAVERKTLLAPPRRRPVMLRPTFLVLTAAASILLVFSVAMLVLRPPRPVDGTPLVLVEIPPVAPRPSGPVDVSVEISAPELDEMPLAPEPESLDAMPAGTIVVSVRSRTPRPAALAEAMVIY